jgi:hypothetical protein
MTRVKATVLVLALGFVAGGAVALPPETSLRPVARGGDLTQTDAESRPQSRPLVVPVAATATPVSAASVEAAVQMAFAGTDVSPDVSLHPFARPAEVEQKALFKKKQKRKGSVCGDLDLQGEVVGTVPGRLNGCGASNAVRVKSVSGVRLSVPSVMTCDTAKALNKWVDGPVQKAFRRQGPVAELKVAAHFACRTRNNRPGAKISEHGKGKAIDIAGFKMQDGDTVTVLKGWSKGRDGKSLKKAWQGACGPFGTVLGPKADRYHKDHFHLDTARHRGGPYCR